MKSQDFSFLRTEGLQLLQRIAGSSWTNHNLHDPGITLLEAGCYALTEMGLRLGMDIADLVASDTSGYQQPFFTAARILPSAPVTIHDISKQLAGHPLVHNAWVYPSLSAPAGRYSVLLELTNEALNSNLFNTTVLAPGYVIELGFPFWDEPVAQPFRQEVVLQNIVLEAADGVEWNSIEDSNAWFARFRVTYTQPPVPGNQEAVLLVVVRIISPLQDPATAIPLILPAVKAKMINLADTPEEIALVRQFNHRVRDAYNDMRIVRRYLGNYRNLCEDFAEFNAARLQEIAISATLEINAGVNPENLLADIFYHLDRFIAPDPVFESLDTLRQRLSPEEIFEGPLLDAGFLSNTALTASQQAEVLYTSDILRIILQQRDGSGTDVIQQENTSSRNIAAVRNVSLANYLDNLPVTINARNCLHLVQSQRHILRLSLLKSRIICLRNGIEVGYDINRVVQLFTYKKQSAQPPAVDGPVDIPVTPGNVYPVSEYYPLQNDLPFAYGVGEAGLPATASARRKAQALQLNGYLFFLEQLTAGVAGQLANFNAFFSARPEPAQTLFSYPLHELSQVAPLLGSPGGYMTALQAATEQEEAFLNRRNRVLNHLLAVLGEDMYDKAELNYRRAAKMATGDNQLVPDLLSIQQAERNIASRQLIREKAAFLHALPALNRDRAQSFGNPAIRREDLVVIQPVANGFHWTILDVSGTPLFRSPLPLPGMAECRQRAAATFLLATVAGSYSAASSGMQYRLVIQQPGSNPADAEIAESVAAFASPPAAMAAVTGLVQTMLQLWVRHTLAPIESRLYHLLGLVLQERRQLTYHPLDEYFELFDDPPPDANIHKRFRLWELPGFAGDTLLVSEKDYAAPADADAVAKAQSAIQRVIDRGILFEHYDIAEPVPSQYQPVLKDAGGDVLARSPQTFATPQLARQEVNRILFHIYRRYNLEGFYMIEHALLYPYQDGDTDLAIPGMQDPYAFQVSFLFPSGYTSNVSLPGSPAAPTHATSNMDPEYRKYVTQQVRKACPAHVLPRIIWIDHMEPGQPVGAADPCFENVEQQYQAWLEAWFTDETATAVISPLRAALVQTLNEVFTRNS